MFRREIVIRCASNKVINFLEETQQTAKSSSQGMTLKSCHTLIKQIVKLIKKGSFTMYWKREVEGEESKSPKRCLKKKCQYYEDHETLVLGDFNIIS